MTSHCPPYRVVYPVVSSIHVVVVMTIAIKRARAWSKRMGWKAVELRNVGDSVGPIYFRILKKALGKGD
jgi:hypothetical protein